MALGAFLSIAVTSCATRQPSTESSFEVEQRADRLIITHGFKPVAHFVFADTNILRPYFAHVHTPDGIQVTRNHPPIAGVDPVDHPTMHPGIWLAFGNISSQDFWRNKATIRHEKFTTQPTTGKERINFATESTMIATNGVAMAKLKCNISITTHHGGYLLIWHAMFTPQTDNFVFGDQEEMGFGIRIATPLSEKNGGWIKNSDGLIGAKNAWGKTAAWCDYSGTLSNRLIGITIMPTQNFQPSRFHSRDYGLLVANPFGLKVFDNSSAPSSVRVAQNVSFPLHFAAFIHSSVTNEPPDLNAVYKTYTSDEFYKSFTPEK